MPPPLASFASLEREMLLDPRQPLTSGVVYAWRDGWSAVEAMLTRPMLEAHEPPSCLAGGVVTRGDAAAETTAVTGALVEARWRRAS